MDVARLHPEDVEAIARRVVELLGAQVLMALGKIDLPAVDFTQARRVACGAADAVAAGTLGYALLVGKRRQ